MSLNNKVKKALCLAAFILLSISATTVWAGFLEMPEIEEVPEAENDILLKDLDIPSVRDRIPNPEAGPRLNVTAFRIQGVVEFPELDITREKLIALVEGSRYNLMKEGKLLYSGYTEEELSELQDLIVDIEKETRNEHVNTLDVQRLVFLIRDQRSRRGVTLGMLEDVADQVTMYYRKRGFILAKAFIPQQRVRDGVVTLTLLLGNLGYVALENSSGYSQSTVERVFSDAMDKPVTTEVMEEKLYYLNDMPGLSVQGFFAPGDQVGDTTLKVHTVHEDAYNVNIRMDNHGSDITGEYRLYSDITLNNPLKYGDRLFVALLGAAVPESATYGALRYGGPLLSHRLLYDIGGSQNAFVLGLEQKEKDKETGEQKVSYERVGGVSTSFDFGLKYQFSRSRVKNTSAGLTAFLIDAEVENDDGIGTHDVVHNIQLSYNYDFLNQKSRVLHNGAFFITRSMLKETVDEFEFEDAWLLGVEYSSLRFINSVFGVKDIRLVLRAGGQYSGQQLSSINQFSLAGPTRSRAYKSNTFFADDGLYLGAELISDGPSWFGLDKFVQPYIFTDAGYGQAYSTATDDTGQENETTLSALLLDAGVGFKFSFLSGLRGNFSIATPLKTKITDDLNIEKIENVKVYLDIQYSL